MTAQRTEWFSSPLLRRMLLAALALLGIVLLASSGYWFMMRGRYSFVDCLYMTVITITTIGYGEIIDLSGNPVGRLYTIAVALCGIGVLTYVLSNVTAFMVEGQFSESFRRKNMERKAGRLEQHYLVCGLGANSIPIVQELMKTRRACVIIGDQKQVLEDIRRQFPEAIVLEGDPTDDELLLTAGVRQATGLFAATPDDNLNLVIALTARRLNAALRIVAGCSQVRHVEKIMAAGADRVVSTAHIGGLRMASEMVRPAVVSFLDTMMRDQQASLRIEEIAFSLSGRPLSSLDIQRFPNSLLMAVRHASGWIFNPPPDYRLEPGSQLIVMTSPEEREKLAQHIRQLPA
ncbi:MAG: potassium channel protein [Lentisphaerae bacterium]|nr:potassium channel protein [Lentisphaerota bacterium]